MSVLPGVLSWIIESPVLNLVFADSRSYAGAAQLSRGFRADMCERRLKVGFGERWRRLLDRRGVYNDADESSCTAVP